MMLQIQNDVLIAQHVAITSDEIITHVDVLSVVELHYRNLKESISTTLFFRINETSDVLAWVCDDVNQTIVVVLASTEKGGLMQFLLGRIMVVDVGDLPVLAISPL